MSGTIVTIPLQSTAGTEALFYRESAPRQPYAVGQAELRRIARLKERYEFYQGKQWSFSTRSTGEAPVTINYCKAIVAKKASFLVGNGVSISVPQALSRKTRPILEKVWKDNEQQVLLMEQALHGGIAGDSFWLVLWSPPTTRDLQLDPMTRGSIKIRAVSPMTCFPVYDDRDRKRLTSVKIVTEVVDKSAGAESTGRIGGEKVKRFIEVYTETEVTTGWEGDTMTTVPNALGEVPLVHVRNEVFPGEVYGTSDLDGVIDLQRELNEKATDLSDIIHYHADPQMVLFGAVSKNVQKSADTLWSVPSSDARIDVLNLNSDLPASHTYLSWVKTGMMELSGVPETTLGQAQAISNTSAEALQVQFQPLVEATKRKSPQLEIGLEKVNALILRYHQVLYQEFWPVDLCKTCGGRIVTTEEFDPYAGTKVQRRKCYHIDQETLAFMRPEKMKIGIKRKLAQGTEYRKMEFGLARRELELGNESFWSLEPKELQEAKANHEKRVEEYKKEKAAYDLRQKQKAESPELDVAEGDGPGDEEGVGDQEEPAVELPPTEPPPLMQESGDEMDVPEEPEKVRVVTYVWNGEQWVATDLGELLLVPTGCEAPERLSPFESTVTLKSALPKDRAREANLAALYQSNGWASREWCREKLGEFDTDTSKLDAEILDDARLLATLHPQKGAAQTPGASSPEMNSQ